MWVPDINNSSKYQIKLTGYHKMTSNPALNVSAPMQLLDDTNEQYQLRELKVKWKRKS